MARWTGSAPAASTRRRSSAGCWTRTRGGYLRTAPTGSFSVERRYRGPTNVLETTFSAHGGRVRATDLMPDPSALRRTGTGYDVGSSPSPAAPSSSASRARSRSSWSSSPPSTTPARGRSRVRARAGCDRARRRSLPDTGLSRSRPGCGRTRRAGRSISTARRRPALGCADRMPTTRIAPRRR